MNAQMPTLLNLLGMAPISPEGQVGKSTEPNVSGAFDLIFQAFMASPNQANPANTPTPDLLTTDQVSTGSPENSIAPTNEGPRGLDSGTVENPEIPNWAGLTNMLSLRNAPFVTNNVTINAEANPVIAAPKMIEAITTSLPPGTFTVKATTIENGLVTFDLASGNDGQMLKVSIPLESIDSHNDNNPQPRGMRSFSGLSTNQDGIDIEQLINRANVTSLTISSPSGSTIAPDTNSKSAVDKTQNVIAITAIQQGKTLQLFATPRPAEIVAQIQPATIVTESRTTAPKVVLPLAGKISPDTSDDDASFATVSRPETTHMLSETEMSETPAAKSRADADAKPAVANQWQAKYQSQSEGIDSVTPEFEQTKNSSAQYTVTDDVTDGSQITPTPVDHSLPTETAGARTTHQADATFAKEPSTSIGRMTSQTETAAPIAIPKDFDMTTLHTGGTKSVTLQLNPEHLGTARVHLTVQDDMVSARVVVNSHHAKAVVEGSLNDLLQQFERANIRIEQIQVTVSGEWQNSEHNRRQFFQAPRPASRFIKDDDESESITDTVAKLFAPKQSPAFAGLNILA